jgi:thiol-disulfide isomerase/thioredoxin
MEKLVLVILLLFGVNGIAQQKNCLIKDAANGKPMLIGYCTREAFSDSSFSWWFNSEYNMYEVDSTALKDASAKLKNDKITIVMGTWCSDSRREVPRFYKILDYLGYPSDKVKLLMVDRNKKGNGNETDGLNIERVPTIIFYKNDKELGRIVEYPEESLDKDMMKIITGHQ